MSKKLRYSCIFGMEIFHSTFFLLHIFLVCFIPSLCDGGFYHQQCVCICLSVLVAQLCPTLCDPVDCISPGSSVHGILQARVLDWVATPFSRGSSQPWD